MEPCATHPRGEVEGLHPTAVKDNYRLEPLAVLILHHHRGKGEGEGGGGEGGHLKARDCDQLKHTHIVRLH